MPDIQYISYIEIGGVTYEIKDNVARQGGIKFILSTDAATTPEGVTWGNPPITGTLTAAAADKSAFYLVPADDASDQNIYHEFIVVKTGDGQSATYSWEQLGDTTISLHGLVTSVTLNKGAGDNVLGEATTFTNSSSAVSFSGGSSATVLTGITPSTKNLVTTTVTGINGSQSIKPVTNSTDVDIPNVSLGAATEASKIVTSNKTATNTVLGTAEKVNKVSAGTAISTAYAGNAVTQVLSGDVSSVFTAASVVNETLSFTSSNVTKNSITPAVANSGTITPITIGDEVTVPQISSNTSVNFDAVGSNTPVSVPVVNIAAEPIVASKVVLGTDVTLAKPAGAATTVATGALAATGTGDAVVESVSTTGQTETVVKNIGTGTAAAQTITVGSNDTVAVAKYSDLSLTVTNHD